MSMSLWPTQPKGVWDWFARICAVPHASRDTARLADLIEEHARRRGISCQRDAAGNLTLHKPASAGYEAHPGVILQGHLDMVAVREPDCPRYPERDGVAPVCEGDWVFARGTSLGADNGIAVALALAVLDDDTLCHPPLTVLLTNDEEIGMLGANAWDSTGVTARRLLNLDSEGEGVLTVSCAGGVTGVATLPLSRELRQGVPLTLTLKELTGGHSGSEIHKGRGNAVKLLAAVLRQCGLGLDAGLCRFSGGAKDNAIPVEAEATLLVAPHQLSTWGTLVKALEAQLRDRYRETDPYLELTFSVGEPQSGQVMTAETQARVLALVADTPDGVIGYSEFDPSLVQTSLNLGVMRTTEDSVTVTWAIRSSVEQEKEELSRRVKTVAEAQGATWRTEGEYTPWEYRKDSPLREVLSDTWEELTGQKPLVEGIHAGLECGPLCGKLPGLDAVSFGPTMEAVHTTGERMSVSSVSRLWEYVIRLLAKL